MSSMIRRYVVLGVVVLTIIVVDQMTKAYIDGSMYLHESISIIPGYFSLTYIRNPGAAFGIMGTTSSGFRLVFFFLTSILAMGLLITIFLRLDPPQIQVRSPRHLWRGEPSQPPL